jgi:predicted component of type VI protein secretion system
VGKLVLFLADGTTQDIVLGRERLVIGRRADNDICLPYPAVSGEHASVVTILADSFLEDLGSTNGTLVNGKAVTKHFLRDRDEIDIGRQRLLYLMDEAAIADPGPPVVARNPLHGLSETVPLARPLPDGAVPQPSAAQDEPEEMRIPVTVHLERARPRPAVPAPASVRPDPGRDDSHPRPPSRSADQRIAAWAADWAAPAGDAGTGTIDTADVPPTAAAATADPAPAAESAPQVRVLSGVSTGRTVSMARDELSVGRVGVQVAVVRKSGDGFLLVPLEGSEPPRINGTPVPPQGAALQPGDTFEVAGVRLEVSLPR